MSDKPKFPRVAAMAVAAEICSAMRPVTERLIVAGSLRRRKQQIGDVEIVFVPKIEMRKDPGDLLGHLIPMDLFKELIDTMLSTEVLQKRLNKDGHPTWGQENKLARHVASGIGVDFFRADELNWWSLVTCRTGSAESNTRVCMAAEKRGLRWNYHRGFEDRLSGELLFVPQSERQVFEHVGLKYLEPWER